jgi:adenylate cyclase
MRARLARVFMFAGRRRLPLVLLTVVAVGATGLMVAAYSARVFKALEGDTVDARFTVRGSEPPPKGLVIVKVDDRTFEDLNRQWPFPREVFGRLIRRIAADHPAAIALDVQFSEPSEKGTKDDIKLLDAIDAAKPRTVFAMTETDAKGHVRFLGSTKGSALLHQVGSQPANGLFPPDPGGFIRRMSYSVGGLPTLGVVTARVAGHPLASSAFPGRSAWIDYAGPGGTIPSVSFSAVYGCEGCGTVPPGFFRGKTVVVGATAPSLQDIHPTSTDGQMSGPEAQANAIGTVMRGFPLTSAPGWVNLALILAFGLAIPLLSLRVGPLGMTGATIALAALLALGVQLAFNSGRIVAFVYPLGALVLSFGGALAVKLMTEAFERIRTRDLFSRFVPENVVDEVLASADGLRLGGVQREGTVMFVDLRGFTSLAETLEPARVIDTLNNYLREMSDAILDNGGTLVAYMGDGIMAVFGAPLAQTDHADRGLAAAREMLAVRLPRFNAWLQSEGLGEGFKMGIGLNSGRVMSGHVGSERRVEYTAVGDTTNTAARIEQLTKGTEHMLLLSDATREALVEPADDLVFVEEKEIRGRVGTIKLWSLPAAHTSAEAATATATGPV